MAFPPQASRNVRTKCHKNARVCYVCAILFKTEQSCKLQKPLANQDAIWLSRLFHVDHITVEILCIDLHEFWTKSVGAVSKNGFFKNQPHGGAATGLCEKLNVSC